MNFDSTPSRSLPLLAAILAALTGCPIPDDNDTGDDASTPATYSILGEVTRNDAATPTGDGVGTLWVGALTECDLGASVAGLAMVPNADFTAADAAVAFELPDLPPGDVFIALFLDEDLNADPMQPLPSPGDLVYADIAGDGVLSCVQMMVDDEDVEDVALSLTAVVPGG